MADIRKRETAEGPRYQVRYASSATKSGYGYASFLTLKEARAFKEDSAARKKTHTAIEVDTVVKATDFWLKVCEKEGLNGREPVSAYTLKNYRYRAGFIKKYSWPAGTAQTTAPHIVAFRSWLLNSKLSREVASKILSSLHSVMKELVVRGHILHNPVTGISIRAESRFKEVVVIPTKREVIALLRAADELAASKNKLTARTWQRYRPMLYLAADSGMRPQEYLALSHSSLRSNGVYVDRAIEGGGTKISVTKTPAGRRFIELSPETLAMVRYYADNHAVPNDHDLIFPTENGELQSRRNWQRRGFNLACRAAGLVELIKGDDGEIVEDVKYRPYDLRHFFASMLIDKKINLKKIQSLMGHENIETTLNTYGHLLEEAERQTDVSAGLLNGLLASPCGAVVAKQTNILT